MMDQQTLDPDHRSPPRRDAAKRAFQDLLLEAYREREALLRGRVTLIPDSHDADRADARRTDNVRPMTSHAGARRRADHLREVESLPLREPDSPRVRTKPRPRDLDM